MDYSLLFVVVEAERLPPAEALTAAERASLVGGSGSLAYVLGIIDITQQWTLKTRLARIKKACECAVRRQDHLGISTVPVDLYQERFMCFMRSQLLAPASASAAAPATTPAFVNSGSAVELL